MSDVCARALSVVLNTDETHERARVSLSAVMWNRFIVLMCDWSMDRSSDSPILLGFIIRARSGRVVWRHARHHQQIRRSCEPRDRNGYHCAWKSSLNSANCGGIKAGIARGRMSVAGLKKQFHKATQVSALIRPLLHTNPPSVLTNNRQRRAYEQTGKPAVKR